LIVLFSCKKRISLIILFALLLQSGCANQATSMSQVELRDLQTRGYENVDGLVVFKAVINALQDEGFTIKLSDSAAGVLTASLSEKEINERKIAGAAIGTILTGGIFWAVLPFLDYETTKIIAVTANVTTEKNGVKARLSFVVEQYNSSQKLVRADPLQNKEFYQVVFSKVEKSIFLEENL